MARNPSESLDTVDSATASADLRRLRRDPELPAVKFVEDLFPETQLFKKLFTALGARELESITCVNRQFKAECYDARLLTRRACKALIAPMGGGCAPRPSAAEARKWYRVCADMHGTREALCMLGGMANEGGASATLTELISSLGEAAVDLDESERCLRAAIAADDSHPASYAILAPAGHALDVAKVDLALTLANKEWRDREPGADRLSPDVLVETNMLLDEVLGHDAVPGDVPFRDPHREAATLKAQMIHKGEAPGTPSDVLALIGAIPLDKLDANCNYLLGEVYKKLDEETPNDEHARRAFDHITRALRAGHPGTPFDLGELLETGRGTEAHLPRAYYMYVMAAFHAEDPRAVARLAEDVAAGPPYPPELLGAMEEFPELFLSSDGTHDGALDLEEAFGRLGIDLHSSDEDSDNSDDDDDSDSDDDSDDGDASMDAILAEAVQRLRS